MALPVLTIVQLIVAGISMIFAIFIFFLYVILKNAKKNQCKFVIS
jgi:hypothetical protein